MKMSVTFFSDWFVQHCSVSGDLISPDLIPILTLRQPREKCHWPICLVKNLPEINMWGALTMARKSAH